MIEVLKERFQRNSRELLDGFVKGDPARMFDVLFGAFVSVATLTLLFGLVGLSLFALLGAAGCLAVRP